MKPMAVAETHHQQPKPLQQEEDEDTDAPPPPPPDSTIVITSAAPLLQPPPPPPPPEPASAPLPVDLVATASALGLDSIASLLSSSRPKQLAIAAGSLPSIEQPNTPWYLDKGKENEEEAAVVAAAACPSTPSAKRSRVGTDQRSRKRPVSKSAAEAKESGKAVAVAMADDFDLFAE